MSDKNTERIEPLRSITDDQIVTERRLPRRSFLSSTGTLLGGATIVAGLRASTLKNSGYDDPKPPKDPDQQTADPDKRSGDPDKRSTDPDGRRREGDKKREADKKPRDADRKQTDPDKPQR